MAQSTDEYSQVPGYRKGMEKPLTTGSIPLFKLPKCRLTEGIEFLCNEIDCTLTAPLDQLMLSLIVWELTRVKPDIKITEFHATSYLDLYLRLRGANERIKKSGKEDKGYIQKLTAAPVLEDFILQHAVAAGFNPQWL